MNDNIDDLYLQYFNKISDNMMEDNRPFDFMVKKLIEEFKSLGMTNEEKANALTAIYTEQIRTIESESSRAAITLLKQGLDNSLTQERIDTEERKRQGYDDNVLIEIMKAQGGLASFAVNANSDSAQDAIDDLKEIMQIVEDRACDLVCGTPVLTLEFTSDYNTPINGSVYGGSSLTFTVTEVPSAGSFILSADGTFVYTPTDGLASIGSFRAMVEGTDSVNGLSVVTLVLINIIDIV